MEDRSSFSRQDKPATLLARIRNTVGMTNKLLFSIKGIQRQLYIDFLVRHQDKEDFAKRILTSYIGITDEVLVEYGDLLGWEALSENTHIIWPGELLQHLEYVNWWDIKISKQMSIDHLVHRYFGSSMWYELCQVMYLTESSLEKYGDKLDWYGVSQNRYIEWNIHLIQKFSGRLDFLLLSRNINLGVLQQVLYLSEDWDWIFLCEITGVWDEKLVNEHQSKVDWRRLSRSSDLPNSQYLIEKYHDQWDWEELSCNAFLPWSENLIARYYLYWNWEELSDNEAIPWSERLIDRFIDRWDWDRLGRNDSIPWSEKLIEKYNSRFFYIKWSSSKFESSIEVLEKYSERWLWYFLSQEKELKWSEELIYHFRDKWHWSHLSGNRYLPWTHELISKYMHLWDWDSLSYNRSLPWSDELIDKYVDMWNWRNLSYGCRAEIHSFMDEGFIRDVIGRCSQKQI